MMTKEKIGGIIGTIVFSVLLLFVLLFSKFTIALSSPQGLEGIPVMFGFVEDAFGTSEPPMYGMSFNDAEAAAPPVPAKEDQEQSFMTQNTESSIKIPEQKEVVKEEKSPEVSAAEKRQAQEETRKREINQQMSGLFGDTPGGSRGNTHGTGVQGVPTGNATQGAASGIGGIGTYDLGGRSVGSGGLVQPKYTVDDYGTVVVNITVDPSGKVIRAEIGKGTNTPSATLRNEALRAARSTRFNLINSTNNQQGTITYRFNLN
ncbi:MAG TPA: hypothetical protein DDW85_02980 [Porphyromonadaceae bacterium]|nr:hypothetical protein [Porphyromonadaceae bacterium]